MKINFSSHHQRELRSWGTHMWCVCTIIVNKQMINAAAAALARDATVRSLSLADCVQPREAAKKRYIFLKISEKYLNFQRISIGISNNTHIERKRERREPKFFIKLWQLDSAAHITHTRQRSPAGISMEIAWRKIHGNCLQLQDNFHRSVWGIKTQHSSRCWAASKSFESESLRVCVALHLTLCLSVHA